MPLHAYRSAIRPMLAVLAACITAGCASPLFDVGRSETALPVSRAWVDGRTVEYVTTDISDETMARMLGVNYVPRLAAAISGPGQPSSLERVYKFAGAEQISIFQSAPVPAGAGNTDRSYSPLWRLVTVQRLRPEPLRELRSEEELLAAADKGDVALQVTNIVVNCPVTRSADGTALKGVR